MCWSSASEAAPAIEVRGTRFACMMNITLKLGTTILSASTEESREEMRQRTFQHGQASADDACICLDGGPDCGDVCPVCLVLTF